MTDHYKTLGVDRNANQDDIKKAYRKMAAQHHPDRGGDTAKFQEVQAAYETLSDEGKRAQYDNPQPQGFHHFGGGFPPGFEDVFGQMFGGGSPFGDIFGRGHHRPPQRNRTLNIQTTITLEEAYSGKTMIANLQLPSGRDQVLEIKIPAGIQDGMTLRLAEMGDDAVPNVPRGDIHLTVSVAPHTEFVRQGDDLIRNLQINCIDAMLGKTVYVDTINGSRLEIKVPEGTQHGQVLSAAGYGMPKVNDNRFKGSLLLQINITIPKNLNNTQKELLKQINI
jgi:curved DNA-binding protein